MRLTNVILQTDGLVGWKYMSYEESVALRPGACRRNDGFDFEQLRREGDIAIFVTQKPPFTFKSYEVVIIQKRDAYTWPNGQTTPAHEAMPSSRDWGIYG